MNCFLRMCVAASMLTTCFVPVLCQAADRGQRDHVRYEKDYLDPVTTSMAHEADSLRAVNDSISTAIQKAFREKEKKKSEEKLVIRLDWSGVVKPASVAAFKAPFHFPPHPQYRTGTCWSFSTTSFFESELRRLTGQEIKFSEMYTVYWEYVEKALGYVAKLGCQAFSQGSEQDAVPIIWKKYGVVPASAYPGLAPGKDKYDDEDMTAEIVRYLEFVKDHNYWDKDIVIGEVRAILDRYMGRPPEEFEYSGRLYTPKQFLDEIVKLNLDDYVLVMSTLLVPFYTKAKYDVPDNWRPTENYYNVPLDEFYECLVRAAARGYTVAVGGDISEPGLYGFEDAAIVPTFDIPQEYIDQDAREFRFNNNTTQDDHGVHFLAMLKVAGRDWFLVKDSAGRAYWGKEKGYFFFRDDYVRLKMLTLMVHKDMVQFLTPKFETRGKVGGR